MCAIPLRRFPVNNTTLALVPAGDARRSEVEGFIRDVFAQCHGAEVTSFAPELALLEKDGGVAAAAGWRGAGSGTLYLERYLDEPVERRVSRLAGCPVTRDRIVEVGNLAAGSRGGGADMILAMADHLDALGYEWVVFTATRELIGIFTRMGLPPLALAPADPSRLGDQAREWGRYYDTRPVVVAGRIRSAFEGLARARARRQDGSRHDQ
jgi:hypothetical protein